MPVVPATQETLTVGGCSAPEISHWATQQDPISKRKKPEINRGI